MFWALQHNDPRGWLNMPAAGNDWIARADGPFKHALDRTKYAIRYPDQDASEHRANACAFLNDLNEALSPWLFESPSLADFAILPFVRLFAFIDKAWFDTQPWPNLHGWLETFLNSEGFDAIMHKYPQWQPDDPPLIFSS